MGGKETQVNFVLYEAQFRDKGTDRTWASREALEFPGSTKPILVNFKVFELRIQHKITIEGNVPAGRLG